MKQFNKNTDRIIRKKVSDYEFSYQPAAWNDMEALLENNNRNPRFWYFSMLAIAVIFVSLAFMFPSPEHNVGATEQAAPIVPVPELKPAQESPSKNIPQASLIPNLEGKRNVLALNNKNGNASNILGTFKRPTLNKSTFTPFINNSSSQQLQETNTTTSAYSFSNTFTNTESEFEANSPLIETETLEVNTAETRNGIATFASLDLNQASPIHGTSKEMTMDRATMPKAKKMTYGVSAGCAASLAGNQLMANTSFAPQVGLFAEYSISPKISVVAEVQAKYTVASPNNNRSADESTFFEENTFYNAKAHQFAIVQVPVSLKYKINPKNSVTAGVRASFVHTAKHQKNSTPTDIVDPIANFDVGVSVGYERQMTEKLAVDVRYTQGIKDMTSDELYNPDQHTNTDLAVSVRYDF